MARRQAAMVLARNPSPDVTRGQGRYVAVIGPSGKWNGSTAIDNYPDIKSEMNKPVRIKKPTWFFVPSMGDLFHETVSREDRDTVFEIMESCPQHTFLLLTKRAQRMYDDSIRYGANAWPKNVWCGVTVCNQVEADEKIEYLVRMPSPVRFLSIEPMIAPIVIRKRFLHDTDAHPGFMVNWVIVGGESGPGARSMHPDWARGIRDQCADADVPFLFKQWRDKKAGRQLDGKIHDGYPKTNEEARKQHEN
jgi:protein gp37